MGFNIQAKKSIVGSKLTVEQSHIAEIEEYIKSLEAQNIQLLQTNTKQQEELDGMYRKFLEQEDSSERSQSLLDETNTKMISMIEHVPTADEYSRSYDLLLDYQRQLMNRTDTSNDYHMNNGEVALIARYGLEVAENFVLNEHALIPMKRGDIEAKLYLSENYYEQNDGGTINPYSSYNIAVDVIDTRNSEVKKYNLFDFDEKYKDDIETEEMETTNRLIQEDDELIIEERVAISKSKKNRKEKAQGLEIT
ncbi:hypothetical protein [Enterococcus gallinarum]|uniref:hypothetical protein n=1 Tax=Enterococcus gallinarum TaxID=1353 RepID=UPI001AD60B93|nr:hypothetical protein [Enterococcus gallinarum]MBO6420064.1 hypothetical protein [Enterococcus gallinarum]MBO6423061.1 hypothetical protein [Enterococcus gallinarum]